MTTSCPPGCLCDCCVGTARRTPLDIANRQGLGALSYRVGAYGDFYTSMLAALANTRIEPFREAAGSAGLSGSLVRGGMLTGDTVLEFPLAALTARITDDPTIALLDAWSVVLDVLTFYQERIANEGYLRTATEFRSVLELARLVGYVPRPGVAANVFLAYGLEKDSALTIKSGSRAQSVPESGQLPQTFESCEDFYARYRWNSLVPRKARPQVFEPGQTTAGKRVWFAGLNTLLKPNDPMIVVFDNAKGEPFRVKKVEPDNPSQTTMIVLQDFTTMPLLANAKAALQQVNIQINKAVFAYHEAELARISAGVFATPLPTPPEVDVAIKPLADKLATLLAAATVTGEDVKDTRKLLDQTLLSLSSLTTLLQLATENLQDLITRLRGAQEYLSIQTTAFLVAEMGPDLPTDLTGATELINNEYKKLRIKWQDGYLHNLSPITLANLLFQTREFIEKSVSEPQRPQLAKPHKLVRDSLPELVQSIVRAILTRFSHPAQAGVIADARIPQAVLNLIAPLQRILTLPPMNPDELTKLARALNKITADKVTLVSELVGEANSVRADIVSSGAIPDLTKLKDAIKRLTDVATEVSKALTDFGDVPEANSDSDFEEIRATLAGLHDRAQQLHLLIATNALAAAFENINPDEAEIETEDLVLRANVWRAMWLGCTEDAKAYQTALKNVADALTTAGLQPELPNTPETMKTAIDAFIGPVENPKELQPHDPIDIQPDRLCLSTAGQYTAINTLVEQLGQGLSEDELLQALQKIGPLQKSVKQWLRNIKASLVDFARKTEPPPLLSRPEFKDQVDASTNELDSSVFPKAAQVADAIKAQAGTGMSEPVLPGRDRIAVCLALANTLPDNLAQPLEAADQAFSGVVQLLLERGFIEPLLARLRDSLDAVRQQQRLAGDGNYPRVTPWLREFVGSLDQFMSDLELKVPADNTVGKQSSVQTEVDQFPDLAALKLPPSSPPVNSMRLDRRLDMLTSDSGTVRHGSLITDLGPQVAIAFDRTLSGALYDGFTSTKLPRARRFQGVHVLRARSAPFGHNAPLQAKVVTTPFPPPPPPGTTTSTTAFSEWDLHPTKQLEGNILRLDAVFDKVTPGSFVVIERANPDTEFDLENPLVARVESVQLVSPSDYGLQGATVTELILDRPWLTEAELDTSKKAKLSNIRNVTVYVQSEPLELAGEPMDADVGPVPGADDGRTLELDEVYDGLSSGRWLIVSGERTDVRNTTGVKGAEVVMLASASQVSDQEGSPGQGRPHTVLKLATPLSYSYQRGTVTIYGNVVKADQGETKTEILGSGNAAVAGQRFDLKQQPLTYVAAATPTGAIDTAQIRVNGIRWHGANRFTQLGPNDRGYVLRTDAEGKTSVLFGDGVHGARLPTGPENVRATYRVGMGKAGNVAADKITNLLSRPLGVKEVTNPMPAVGGVDRETTDQARRNAPIGVLALERLVSVPDYADFARSYAGIEKAYSTRISDGYVQRLHLTIAGRDGEELAESSDLNRNFVLALRKFGDPAMPLTVAARRLSLIVIVARVRVLPDYEFEPVVQRVRERMLQQFGFEYREFGQDVLLSEVIATIQHVRGVAGVVVDRFGLLHEKRPDGTLTPLGEIVKQLQEIAAGKPNQNSLGLTVQQPAEPADPVSVSAIAKPLPRLAVATTVLRDGKIVPAEIAILSPRVADTLILNEWTS